MLSVRTLQKPRFIIENGELRLTNVPVVPDQIKYFKDHPPQIISYLYRCITRGILYNRYKLFANQIEKIDTKKKINAKIIEAINDLAHKENYPLTFVLFYSNVSLLWDVWQEQFLKDELTRLNIPYVDTKNVLLEYLSNHPDGILDLYEPSSHHIDLGNQIIGDLLLNYLKQHNIK
jgi:hypothetical protein